jgi:DNA invertase Pin-like site-specific DNA recombinase
MAGPWHRVRDARGGHRQLTAAGRLVAGVLGSIAEFERARIQERIRAWLNRARAQGTKIGRRPNGAARRLNTELTRYAHLLPF